MPHFKDQAICIRLIDWSETSQIVGLLTEHHGKLNGVAKGSKRTSPGAVSRYSGGIELLTQGQIVGISKPTAELATLTEWDLQEPHWHLRRNLRSQQISMYAADLTGALVEEHDPHPKVFAALSRLLAELSNPDLQGPALLAFQWRLLEDCGYRPQIDLDVETDRPLSDPSSEHDAEENPGGQEVVYTFDPRAGGITTRPTQNGSWRVRGTTVELLRRVASDQPLELDSDKDLSESITRANRLLCVYARAILDRELPTMAYVL